MSDSIATPLPAAAPTGLRRPRNLAAAVVESIGDRIRDGRLGPGAKLATETALMVEFGVSRTVIREALSKLQAAALVQTRHGIGTFVAPSGGDSAVFRIRAEQLETLQDVVAMLELRIGVETEAAGLAAQRRTDDNLQALRRSLEDHGETLIPLQAELEFVRLGSLTSPV